MNAILRNLLHPFREYQARWNAQDEIATAEVHARIEEACLAAADSLEADGFFDTFTPPEPEPVVNISAIPVVDGKLLHSIDPTSGILGDWEQEHSEYTYEYNFEVWWGKCSVCGERTEIYERNGPPKKEWHCEHCSCPSCVKRKRR